MYELPLSKALVPTECVLLLRGEDILASSLHHGHAHRYRQIAAILIRHGLGYLVTVFGLERFAPFQLSLPGSAERATMR
jgi:hypothetical protein